MSSIGPGSLGAINLAGSLAGAQRNTGDADRLKQSAAQRNASVDLNEKAAQSIQGIGETDESADRDADGRSPYDFVDGDEHSASDSEDPSRTTTPPARLRAEDVDGNRGVHLDLEA